MRPLAPESEKTYMNERLERISTVLGAMAATGPRRLRAYLAKPGPDFDEASAEEVEVLIEMLLAPDPNSPAALRFSSQLHAWDNERDTEWAGASLRNTPERRARIHECLCSGEDLSKRIDSLLPYYHLEEPVVIAVKHRMWYEPRPGIRDYYWRSYRNYLHARRHWESESLLDLDNSTRAIVEHLANPEATEAYASRGLVMGYVQSGKTSNFAGVVARAADAGYRLIIVLGGTWNILRNQTQRRFDKELLGKELLRNDETYTAHPPADWSDFLEHGQDPVEAGHYTWQRLTRPDIDFKSLKAAIDNLEFERRDRSQPIYAPANLHALPVKLLVVKKHSGILKNLVSDLNKLRTRLAELPALVIDDESDQAGLNNNLPPRKRGKGTRGGEMSGPEDPAGLAKERSETNKQIVALLGLLPRGQYVGYTATPYANALVNPDDPEDLFPRDFIVSLDRPRGYMGITDFFDPRVSYEDLDKDDFSLPEVALIRRVEKPAGEDDEELKAALRSYVLSGALKLFRLANGANRYKAEWFRHHTMLVHTSPRKGEMVSNAARLKELWDQCAFNSPRGLGELEDLWNRDFLRVSAARENELVPAEFSLLIPWLSEAIKRIERGQKVFLILNSDSPDAPDFSTEAVWKIVVGGNKLSRGYTIEGLTVSYYRRVATAADTLMQMGRWFGFRPGYRDLVRVFLGVKEGRKGSADLVALFKETCRMEESFREDVKRYLRKSGEESITPRQVPPLITVSGGLPPVSRKRMFNARMVSKNYSGRCVMPTVVAASSDATEENRNAMGALLSSAKRKGALTLGAAEGQGNVFKAMVFEADNASVLRFLKAFRWLETQYGEGERPEDTMLQIEFLEKQKHGISSWLIVAPQRRASYGNPLTVPNVGEMTVKERHRNESGSFQVFGEPLHREIAEFLSGVVESGAELFKPNEVTSGLRNVHRGICLLYPVREEQNGEVAVGYELQYPRNDLPFDMNFTVRRKGREESVVVEARAGSDE
jgi:hypothetical protein